MNESNIFRCQYCGHMNSSANCYSENENDIPSIHCEKCGNESPICKRNTYGTTDYKKHYGNVDQEAKMDAGKPRLSLVPMQIILDVAKIREYGVAKYGEKESWRSVSVERYHDAFLRHALACANDLTAKDKESGLPHLHHAACNLAFILELMKEE